MKVALTVWEGRISPVFDVCREALVLEIGNGNIVSTAKETLDTANPLQKIARLADLGVETLICGAVSEPLHTELTSRGLNVIGFVAGEVDEVVQALVSGRLPAPPLSMPGCGARQRRRRSGRGRGRAGGRRRGRKTR